MRGFATFLPNSPHAIEGELLFKGTTHPSGAPPGSTFFKWFETVVGSGAVGISARYTGPIADNGFACERGAGIVPTAKFFGFSGHGTFGHSDDHRSGA